MKKKLISAIFLLMVSVSAYAQDGPRAYWAGGGSLMTFDDGFDEVKPINIFGRIGYDFNANFGVGGELSVSLIEDDIGGVDFSVTTTFLYLKAGIPVGDGGKLYAMFGPTNVELTGSAGGFSASADDDGTGVGFGFAKDLGSNSVSVDYINYYDDNGVEVYAFNLAYVSYF